MTRLILHAGFHKTGTSAIQYFASRNRRPLRQGGILYPSVWPLTRRPRSGHHSLIHALAGGKSGAAVDRTRLEGVVRRWRRQAIAADCSVLVSSEAICRYMPSESRQQDAEGLEFVSRLKSLFSGFEVLPLLVIRRQDDFVRSLYQEHVAAGSGESARISFPEFLERFAVDKARFLHRLRGFREQFGKVRVLVYEELSGPGLPISFFEALGVQGLKPGASSVVRRSLSVAETLVKQRLNHWITGRYQNRLVMFWLRSRGVQRAISRELGACSSLWPDLSARRDFIARFEKENAMIASEFLHRAGPVFPALEADEGVEGSCPSSETIDAAIRGVVESAQWRLQAIIGRQAVNQLLQR